MTSSTEDLLLENFWLVAAGFGAGLQAGWKSLKIKRPVWLLQSSFVNQKKGDVWKKPDFVCLSPCNFG